MFMYIVYVDFFFLIWLWISLVMFVWEGKKLRWCLKVCCICYKMILCMLMFKVMFLKDNFVVLSKLLISFLIF